MKYVASVLTPLFALFLVAPLHADLNSDLAFTAFTNVDLNPLAGGKVLQAKGGLIEFERGLTSQSLYIIDAAPADVKTKLVTWNPSRHADLKVWLHETVASHPTAADYAILANLPSNSSDNNLLSSTKNADSSLQLDSNEMALLQSLRGQGGDARALATNFWSQILAGRADRFLEGKGEADYYVVGGQKIESMSDIRSLLRSDSKIYAAFHPILSQTPLYKPSLQPADVYCDCFDVEGTAALGTGAVYQTATADGSISSADIEFYVESGIYVSLELEKLWPVTINGRNETLVWRDDLVSTSSIAYLHGTERVASGMIMLQDVRQAIDAFRSEFK